MKKVILLSFDIEEFDITTEYGQLIPEIEQFEVSLQGFKALLQLLDRLKIRATLFVTANFALRYPDLIQQAAQSHEISSHGFYHSRFTTSDLADSKQVLEQITQTSVIGFRMARLQPVDQSAIAAAGYRYNSSLNPTYLPGRYNHLRKPRTAHRTTDLLNIPVSVTPLIRLPLFWLSFKNLPFWLIKAASQWTLNHDGYLSLYFHPWEFADLSDYALPFYVKRRAGKQLLDRLEHYLRWLSQRAEFITLADFEYSFNRYH
jgi:peptidoglycan/xylan/chitin deacetylase (PgdA/CDA1 family)